MSAIRWFAGLFLVILCAAAGCGKGPTAASAPVEKPVCTSFPEGEKWQVEIPLQKPEPVVVRIRRTDLADYSISLTRGGIETAVNCEDISGFALREYAVLGSGPREQLLLVGESGGTGASSTLLSLLNASTGSLVTLSFGHNHSGLYPEDEEELPENAAGAAHAEDLALLRRLKYAFGFTDAEVLASRGSDPELCWYFWRLDNYPLGTRPLKARTYPGKPVCRASVNAELVDGDETYTAYFKAGVVAYDKRLNAHWVVYHPDDYYDWPTCLLRHGPYLVIGMRYGAVAAMDLTSRRLGVYQVLGKNEDVESLAVRDGKVLANGLREVPLGPTGGGGPR